MLLKLIDIYFSKIDMKHIIITLLIILASSVCLFAQEKSACPKVEIIGPSSSVSEGQTMTFTVRIVGGDYEKEPKIKWSVNKGKIVSGQGKSSVIVSTDDLDSETLTAKAELEGLEAKCKSSFSETGIVITMHCGSPVDDFGDIANDDVRARIDAFIADLQNNPTSSGIIVQYGEAKTARKREKLIVDHIEFRSFDRNIITFQYRGNERDFTTRLWRVPAGAETSCIY